LNFLRRFYLLLITVLLIVLVSIFLLSPQTVSVWAGTISEQSSLIRVLVTVVVGALLLFVTWLQIRPDPKAQMTGLMMRVSGAITEVSVESARERILKAVSDVPDVVSAEAQVKPIRGRADIELDVTVFGYEVKLPNKQKEINRALNQVINKQLGLRMASQPRVHIKIYGEEPKKPASPVLEKPLSPPISVIVEKPISSPEPEPKQSSGFLGGWRRESDLTTKSSEPTVEKVVSEPVEPIKPDFNPPVDAEKPTASRSDSFVLNLEKEIADSSTEDFFDEELGVKPMNGSDVGDLSDEDAPIDPDKPKESDTTNLP